MAQVIREEVDGLNSIITVKVEKDVYVPKVKKELSNLKNKAQLKGFRKGKTPMSYIRKVYGKGVVAEVINKTIQDELDSFIQSAEFKIIGQPLPVEDQEFIDFDLSNLLDHEFKFEIGHAPLINTEIDYKTTDIVKYKVTDIPAHMIDEEIENARKRDGERKPVEDNILDNDMVSFNAEEMDGDDLKENGWAASFSVLVQDATDELKEILLTKKAGDEVVIDVTKMEKNTPSEEQIRTNILGVTEADEDVVIGNIFKCKINEVNRVAPAELTEEFFTKNYGPEVHSEEAARQKIEEELIKYFDLQSQRILESEVFEHLLEQEFDLPDAFLKRWLLTLDEKNTPEVIEQEYDSFLKGMRWNLLRDELSLKHNITVTKEDINQRVKSMLVSYGMGQMGEEMLNNFAESFLERDPSQKQKLAEEILTSKTLAAVAEKNDFNEVPKTVPEFEEIVKEKNAKNKAQEQQQELEASQENNASEELVEDAEIVD